ncbi:ADP-ribosylglycohydrolase family protein [Chryseolinea lacunae]|uniref:ADP-ribosylglycohydrolase family protein n=1 Tax=Chryseolinea lacunae TaxID=2801331 RepID=A0ABS1KRD7_9BACT|nr:ADP-ribosylglycohydrolase family protein [Chryseolinea lacunae]MBL0742006.1 ADP-ribosylglycohydrolase family protein [Chryseolinea lacunae]
MTYAFDKIKSCFLGLAVGDALGVPVEFSSRAQLLAFPVTTMIGYKVWNQPPGTWSDDSSLSFCLAESLCDGYQLNDVGQKFLAWFKQGYWGAHHQLFDIGGTTRLAIERIQRGEDPRFSGEVDEDSNGNGSLMRIAPAALYFADLDIASLHSRINEVSSITHAHFRSVFSCVIYSRFVAALFEGKEKFVAFHEAIDDVNAYCMREGFNAGEMQRFGRILDKRILHASEDSIGSQGYVMHTLEASLWCFLTTDNFKDAVLKAVNLGGDTDTTGCVTGALAGLYYGEENIPAEWIRVLARQEDITNLSKNFTDSVKKRILHPNS